MIFIEIVSSVFVQFLLSESCVNRVRQQPMKWTLKVEIKRWGPNVKNINVENNKNINVEFWR